ncbi:MAG: hypothetical protein HRT89_06525 [Lentisphaeria bacterium]|nr:hypothetical protein [Lentisphaeria bacterium]NQZ67708.1 hypothetical protein [Lentisphaeria bacterium]
MLRGEYDDEIEEEEYEEEEDEGEYHTFRSKDGSKKLIAKVISVDGDNVILVRKKDGREIEMKVSSFQRKDQAYLRSVVASYDDGVGFKAEEDLIEESEDVTKFKQAIAGFLAFGLVLIIVIVIAFLILQFLIQVLYTWFISKFAADEPTFQNAVKFSIWFSVFGILTEFVIAGITMVLPSVILIIIITILGFLFSYHWAYQRSYKDAGCMKFFIFYFILVPIGILIVITAALSMIWKMM